MPDLKDKIREALFLPRESHAGDNLHGALIDIRRFRELGIPTDHVCIATIERVIKQLAKAERVLDGDG